jgi:hypothetical protein
VVGVGVKVAVDVGIGVEVVVGVGVGVTPPAYSELAVTAEGLFPPSLAVLTSALFSIAPAPLLTVRVYVIVHGVEVEIARLAIFIERLVETST